MMNCTRSLKNSLAVYMYVSLYRFINTSVGTREIGICIWGIAWNFSLVFFLSYCVIKTNLLSSKLASGCLLMY